MQRLTYVLPLTITAMAIIENLWLRKSKKKLAGVVLYQAMEQTRARELATSVSNPRTQSQMAQRVKWSQLVSFYRANADWMKYAYETKTPQQSEYNKFMQLNTANSNIYMTKEQASFGACVVMPYVMTQGSLPSINFTEENGSWPSNIYYPSGSFLLNSTTIAEFSQKLIAQNPAMQNGDQLSFIRFTQQEDWNTGYPFVQVRKYELVLDITSTELVGAYFPLDYISVVNVSTINQLAVVDSGLAGGFLLVLSRTQGGKTYVSSQSIITTRMDDIITAFSSANKLATSIASYGENPDAFLSSTTANINSQAPTQLAIVMVSDGANNMPPGSLVKMSGNFAAGDTVSITFNGNVGTVLSGGLVLSTNKKGVSLGSPSSSGSTVTGTVGSSTSFADDEYLISVSVRFEDGYYVATYQSPQVPNNS